MLSRLDALDCSSRVMWPLCLQLAGLALLTICWVVLRRKQRGDRAHEDAWTGTPMDARPLLGRLQQLRQDYLQLFRSQAHRKSERKSRLHAARQAVRDRSYFDESRPEVSPGAHPEQKTDAEAQRRTGAEGEESFLPLPRRPLFSD